MGTSPADSRLLAIIDTYKDAHGQPSDASIARAIDVSPQLISLWRKRGFRDLPERHTMESLAAFMGLPYREVLEAALQDAGYVAAPRLDDGGGGGGRRVARGA